MVSTSVDIPPDATYDEALQVVEEQLYNLDVSEVNEGLSGGSYYEYSLGIQHDTIAEALRETNRLSGLF